MKRHIVAVPLAALALLALAACSSPTPGNPGPITATSASSTTQAGGSSTSPSGNADPLANTDPCTLLPQAVISQNKLETGTHNTGPGVRECRWNSIIDASNIGKTQYFVAVGIYDSAGLDQLSTNGFTVTNYPVGRHQGRLSQDNVGSTCAVSIGVTATSRVDVVGIVSNNDESAACAIAKSAAPSVEQSLPAIG